MYGHGQFSTKLYNDILEACTYEGLVSGQGLDSVCNGLLSQINTQVGGYYAYNLYGALERLLTLLTLFIYSFFC